MPTVRAGSRNSRWPGSDPSDASGSRWRLLLGVAVLVVAVGGLVLPAAADRTNTGSPAAAPLPLPPAVGTCITIEQAVAVEIDCSQPHIGEVSRTWRAGEKPTQADLPVGTTVSDRTWTSQFFGLPVAPAYRLWACSGPAAEWAGLADPDPSPADQRWVPNGPEVGWAYIEAPPDERAGALGWSGCLVVAGDRVPYTGSVRGVGTQPGLPQPNPFGSCWSDAIGLNRTDCGYPHRIELLGRYQLTDDEWETPEFSRDVPMTELLAGCTALAAELTGVEDPTYGGALEIRPVPMWVVHNRTRSIDPAATAVISAVSVPDCYLQVRGAGALTATVVGLGAQPLPVIG